MGISLTENDVHILDGLFKHVKICNLQRRVAIEIVVFLRVIRGLVILLMVNSIKDVTIRTPCSCSKLLLVLSANEPPVCVAKYLVVDSFHDLVEAFVITVEVACWQRRLKLAFQRPGWQLFLHLTAVGYIST
jgi:hypothetical protein